jgi:glycosyltransferase involved in cell wall biosynthesis
VRVVRVIGILEPGGAQLSALRLARAQAELGVETRLVAGDATPQGLALAQHFGFEAEALQVHDEIRHSSRQWTPDPEFAEWLMARVAPADLVHAHMFGAWWAAAATTPHGVPLVGSEHNAMTWPLGEHRQAATAASRHLDRLFVHGPGPLAFAGELGMQPDRVVPGRSAIALHTTPRPGLETPRVTFTGRLREDKGPDLLVKALSIMQEPPVTYLVGDGPMQHEIRRLIDRLGLHRRVHMTGWSYQPGRYVAGAAVHVVPSREEAWSQSAVTALALHVPVVATAVDGLPITLAENRGLLVQPDPDAIAGGIQRVLDGAAGIDLAAGRQYAARFEPAEIASYYLAIYEQLIAARSAAADARRQSPVRVAT